MFCAVGCRHFLGTVDLSNIWGACAGMLRSSWATLRPHSFFEQHHVGLQPPHWEGGGPAADVEERRAAGTVGQGPELVADPGCLPGRKLAAADRRPAARCRRSRCEASTPRGPIEKLNEKRAGGASGSPAMEVAEAVCWKLSTRNGHPARISQGGGGGGGGRGGGGRGGGGASPRFGPVFAREQTSSGHLHETFVERRQEAEVLSSILTRLVVAESVSPTAACSIIAAPWPPAARIVDRPSAPRQASSSC